MIPVDPSVTEGRCYFCDDPVVVPPTAGDVAGPPLPAGAMPEHPVLVRMCDECRAGFERWKREDALSPETARRSDA